MRKNEGGTSLRRTHPYAGQNLSYLSTEQFTGFLKERAASCYAVNLRIRNTKMGAGTSGPEVTLRIRLDERNLQSKNSEKINREITRRIKQQERGRSTRLRMVRINERDIRLSNALVPLGLSLC